MKERLLLNGTKPFFLSRTRRLPGIRGVLVDVRGKQVNANQSDPCSGVTQTPLETQGAAALKSAFPVFGSLSTVLVTPGTIWTRIIFGDR